MKNACEEFFFWVENGIVDRFPCDQPNMEFTNVLPCIFILGESDNNRNKIESFVTVLADVSFSLFDFIYIKTSSFSILN